MIIHDLNAPTPTNDQSSAQPPARHAIIDLRSEEIDDLQTEIADEFFHTREPQFNGVTTSTLSGRLSADRAFIRVVNRGTNLTTLQVGFFVEFVVPTDCTGFMGS
jgi:hypothetical protein